jgi:hypothetical protein
MKKPSHIEIVDFGKGRTSPINGRLLLLPIKRNTIGPSENIILMSTRIFTLIANKISIWAPKIMKKVAMVLIISCRSLVSNPLRSGGVGKSNHSRAIHLSSRASPKGPLPACLPPGFSTFSVAILHSWCGRLKLERGELPQGGSRQQELWRGTRQQKRDSERVPQIHSLTHCFN